MRITTRAIMLASSGLLMAVSGCTSLPSSGPDDKRVQSQASIQMGLKDRAVGLDYVLLDLTKTMLPYFERSGAESLKIGFGGGRGEAPETVVGVGDIIAVTIFESSAGGLFIPSEAGSRPGNYITLPQQTVDRSGTISVPYAGRIKASGRSTEVIAREIEASLANRAIEPQVIVSITENRSSRVSVLGDVENPAQLEINPAGERILSVIARAGGLKTPGAETYVTLQRRGREGTILFSDLVNKSDENIFVAAGDTIYVNRERRTFLAFGASGLNGRLDFEETGLTLAEAVAKAGGLLDARADPAQVLLYRQVDRKTLNSMGMDVSRFTGPTVPAIIRVNLRDPSTFFAMKELAMVDKDVVYIANADSTELTKFLNIIGTITGNTAGSIYDVDRAINIAK